MRFAIACFAGLGSGAIGSAARAADGCAPGNYSATPSPDGHATSVLFNDLAATAGGSTGSPAAHTTCRLGIPTASRGGYSVYQLDYRGFSSTAAGQATSVKLSANGKPVVEQRYTGPDQRDVILRQRMGLADGRNLDLGIDLNAIGPLDPNSDDALILIDSLDIARTGYTTFASLKASANQLARQRQSLTEGVLAEAHRLLASGERLDDQSSISGFAWYPTAAGLKGRWNAGNGWSFLGGGAIVKPDASGLSAESTPLLAGAVRYTTPPATWRAFGEAGVSGSPWIDATFTRNYQNLAGMVSASGTAQGSFFDIYGRIGGIYTPDAGNEIALSVEIGQSWLSMDSYREDGSGNNMFAATVDGGSTRYARTAATLQWSHEVDDRLDFTVFGTAGRASGAAGEVATTVDWVGGVTGEAESHSFGTFGGRVGVKLGGGWQLDGNASVTSGAGTGASWSGGLALKASF